jgi:hypothetical protein
MADGFPQADALASTIVDALDGSNETLDEGLAAWGRWRDKDAAEHYWFAVDLGRAGPIPTPLPELAKRLIATGRIDQYTNPFNHRTRPSQVISPPRVLAATGKLLARRGCERRALLRDVSALLGPSARVIVSGAGSRADRFDAQDPGEFGNHLLRADNRGVEFAIAIDQPHATRE